MGNTHVKSHQKPRNKKQVHWKAAARPQQPGKPHLISETENTPDLVTIRWEKPASDGGAPIFGYLVEHRRTGSPHWVRSTPLLVQTQELTISGLEPGWRYQFRVSAENAVGMSDPGELSEPITVTLQRSAVTAPRFTEELKETTALEDEQAEFVVHFLGQPSPKVCWFKDSFEIFSSRRIRITTDSEKSVLTIHQTSLSDEGEIKCTATNRSGHVSTKAKLTVEAPPTIRLPRQYEDGLLFELGEMIRLKVSVAGRPTPLVFWSHNEESIRNNDRYEVHFSEQSSTLKIGEANREDRGEYHIKAVNKLGEDNQSFLVTVTDKPSPPGRARVVMALGRSVTLSWSTPHDDGGCKVGNYIVEYYRLGWNVWLKASTSRQLTTMLGDLIEGSEYKFRVKAESPYGMSDPGEESDVVFIPDPKRGILQPSSRSQSQPRDVNLEPVTPVPRRKNRQRSQSSTSVENTTQYFSNINIVGGINQIPKRPERNKVKSPPKTPEASPMAFKRMADTKANKEIFEQSDRSSVARDLAYGSPSIKLRKDSKSVKQLKTYSSESEKSRTPSPSANTKMNQQMSPIEKKKSPTEITELNKSSTSSLDKKKDKNYNSTGSSEFMLVLYPGENEEDQFDSIPPPMSLSAPELGSEIAPFDILRNSASSSELLHERAMTRLYQAAEAEEKEIERRRRSLQGGNDIPKIQINSVDDQILVGLERQSSIKRRLSLGGSSGRGLMNQRRLSLKNSLDNEGEVLQGNLRKFRVGPGEKEGMLIERLRSKSEEDEDKVFEELRMKMDLRGQSGEKHKVRVIDEDAWNDDYSSSTDESESDVDVKSYEKFSRRYCGSDEDDTETYHPGNAKQSTKENEPFEILTIRKDPPSPDFVPKPILKKTEHEEHIKRNNLPPVPQARIRSRSPIPRGRSQSLADTSIMIPSVKKPTEVENNYPRQRSVSLLPRDEMLIKRANIPQIPTILENPEPYSVMHSISAAATISGITAASIVIPTKLIEKQKDAEEAKVVIDHYGDIVKNYGNRRQSFPRTYPDRAVLKKATEVDVGISEENKKIFDDREDSQSLGTSRTSIDTRTENVSTASKTSENMICTPGFKSDEMLNERNIRDDDIKYKQDISNITDNSRYSRISNKTSVRQQKSPETPQTSTSRMQSSVSHQSRKTSASPMRSTKTRTTSISPSMRNRFSTIIDNSPSSRISAVHRQKTPEVPQTSTSQMHIARKTSASPMRSRNTSTSPSMRNRTKSVGSPSRRDLPPRRRPMLREIMTQTSEGLMESFDNQSRSPSPMERSRRQEELIAQAEVKVHRFVDYSTDLAMFIVACWLYLFQNELLAIPVLLVMVYRQLQDEISKRIPKWIVRRWKRKPKK